MKNEIIADHKYNKLIAIEPSEIKIDNFKCWLFLCECGKQKILPVSRVTCGKIKSCGCGQSRFKDLTGQKFGKLTVIKPVSKNHSNNTIWLCLCECGNYTEVVNSNLGKAINSCGCLLGNKVDLLNKKFGKLTVIKEAGRNKFGKVNWMCECECGNRKIINSNALLTNNTKSCGKCNLLIKTGSKIIDEWDSDKNKETDIFNVTVGENKKYWWICKKCGNSWSATVHNRFTNRSGCPKCKSSKAESDFEEILKLNNVKYEKEKKYPDCKNIDCLRFDFYLSDYNLLIELQGEQHYKKGRYKNAIEKFERTKINDNIKKEYCKQNNIKLIEISYKNFKKEEYLKILKEELGICLT